MEKPTLEKIKSLKERAAIRETARYSKTFKEDATEIVNALRKQGWTQQRISKTLEIPWVTLQRWMGAEALKGEKASGFRSIEVVTDVLNPVLVSPAGWRIEGLTMGQVMELLGRL